MTTSIRGILASGIAVLIVAANLVAALATAQVQPSAEQREQTTDFVYFLRAYEQRFGPMPPQLKQQMIATASNEIAEGRYEAFIAGLRQAVGVGPTFGERPDAIGPGEAGPGGTGPAGPTGPGTDVIPGLGDRQNTGPGTALPPRFPGPANPSGTAASIAGMRVFYMQRSPIGVSHASGEVHFCPGGYFHEGSEATMQNPRTATANVNAGQWRIENGPNGPVVGIYYRQGPRDGQRIEYRVSNMMRGRWRTTNWHYAVDRNARCR